MISFLRFLTEGKHWPEDYIKTAINTIKSSALAKQSWYSESAIEQDVQTFADEFIPLSHKNSNLGYFSGIIRMFVQYSGTNKTKYQEFIERKLDTIIQKLLIITNDDSLNTQEFKNKFQKTMSYEDFEKETKQIEDKIKADQENKLKN